MKITNELNSITQFMRGVKRGPSRFVGKYAKTDKWLAEIFNVIRVNIFNVITVNIFNVIRVNIFNVITVNIFNVIRVNIFNVITVNIFNVIRVNIFNVITVNIFNVITVNIFNVIRVNICVDRDVLEAIIDLSSKSIVKEVTHFFFALFWIHLFTLLTMHKSKTLIVTPQ